jgi:urea transporter
MRAARLPPMSTDTPTAEPAALRTLLRSLGQIVLQENAFTGACLLAAWLVCAPRLACAALIGAVAANIGAVLAGCDDADTRAGLHGFNGALAGLAAFVFIGDGCTAAAVAILAGSASAWLIAPLSRWLRPWGAGFYSSPCLLVTWLWLPFARHEAASAAATPAQSFWRLFPAGLPGARGLFTTFSPHVACASSGGLPLVARAAQGILAGLAQTGFASGPWAGLLVLGGIAAASRRHALLALAGAGLGSAVQVWLGASPAAFDAGLLGLNGALTALALAGRGRAAATGGILWSAALQQIAMRAGLPALTAPFVVATWSVVWLTRRRYPEQNPGPRVAAPPGAAAERRVRATASRDAPSAP